MPIRIKIASRLHMCSTLIVGNFRWQIRDYPDFIKGLNIAVTDANNLETKEEIVWGDDKKSKHVLDGKTVERFAFIIATSLDEELPYFKEFGFTTWGERTFNSKNTSYVTLLMMKVEDFLPRLEAEFKRLWNPDNDIQVTL